MKQLMLAFVLALASSLGLAAESWPAKPVHIIVPFPPGSSPDLIARMLTDKLAQALGQPVIVENKPGAGGNLGTGLVAKAEPDGYTLGLSIPGPLAVNTVLYKKMEYDPFTELAPITLVALSPNVLIVNPGLGVNSVKEFIDYAKARPGKLNYGSVGNGSASHLTMELLKMQAGLDIVHVPYKGTGQSVPALLGGQVSLILSALPSIESHVKAGRLRLLAVSTAKRSPEAPEVPAIAELGVPGYDFAPEIGILAPAATPGAVVQKLAAEIARAVQHRDVVQRFAQLGIAPVGSTPQAYAAVIRASDQKYARAVKLSGAKAD